MFAFWMRNKQKQKTQRYKTLKKMKKIMNLKKKINKTLNPSQTDLLNEQQNFFCLFEIKHGS